MPAAFKTALGNAAATASGTTCVITTTAAIAVGDLVVVRWAADNLNASTPTGTVTDSGGNTYTAHAFRGNNATAAAGVVGGIAATKATAAVASGGTITLTLSGSVVQKAMYAESFTGVDNTLRVSTVVASGATTTPSVTSGSAANGDLVIGCVAIESRTAPSAYDSDTSNGSWSTAVLKQSNTTGTDATLVEVVGQYKIVTATATQIYNLTIASTDWAAMICAFVATVVPSNVPVRTFDSVDDRIEFSPSSLVGMSYGTIVGMVKINATQTTFVSNSWFGLYTSGNAEVMSAKVYYTAAATAYLSLMIDGTEMYVSWPNPTTTTWRFVAIAKGTGTVAPKVWVYDFSTFTWLVDNVTATGTKANSANTVAKEFIGWEAQDNQYLKGDIAAVATWKNVALTDAQVKTLINNYAAWFATSPTQVKVLNQASIATLVPDQLDAGSTQTAIVGTAVTTSSPFADTPVAPPVYVSSGAVYVDGVTTSPTLSLTHAAGDLLLAVAQQYPGTSTTPTPTGWTLVDGPLDTSNPTRSWCWKRIADGTATDNLTLTFSQSSSGGVVGVAIRNQDATTPIDVVATPVGDHAQSSTSTRALTSLSPGSLDVHIGILSNNSTWYAHTPTGAEVERLNGAAQWAGVMVSTEQHPVSGSVRAAIPYTHDTSVDAHLRSFVIRSAAAPAPAAPTTWSDTTFVNINSGGNYWTVGAYGTDTWIPATPAGIQESYSFGAVISVRMQAASGQAQYVKETAPQVNGEWALKLRCSSTPNTASERNNGYHIRYESGYVFWYDDNGNQVNLNDFTTTWPSGPGTIEARVDTGHLVKLFVNGTQVASFDYSATPLTGLYQGFGSGRSFVVTAAEGGDVGAPPAPGPVALAGTSAGTSIGTATLSTTGGVAPPSVVATTYTAVGPSTTGVSKPAGGTTGDYYVIYYNSEAQTTITFSGFTADPRGYVTIPNSQGGQWFWKAHDGSEGSTFTNTGGNGGKWTGYLCFLVRGLPAGWTPYIPPSVGVQGSNPLVYPAVGVPDGTLMLAAYKDWNASGYTPPAAWTVQTPVTSLTGYSQPFSSAATAGPFTASPSTSPPNTQNMGAQLFSAATMVYADNFNRSNGALGSPWVAFDGGLLVASNKATVPDSGLHTSRYNQPIAADQWAEMDIVWVPGGSIIGPCVRFTTGGDLYYFWFDGSNRVEINKRFGGSYTTIAGSVVTVAPTTFKARIEVQGTTFRAYIDGTLAFTGTDSSIATGQPGILAANGTGGTADNWRCGPMPYTPSGGGGAVALAGSSAGVATTTGTLSVPSQSFADNFNRTGPALGSSWEALPGIVAPVISGNTAVPPAAGVENGSRVVGMMNPVQLVAATFKLGADYSEAGVFAHGTASGTVLLAVYTTDGTHPAFPGFGDVDGPAYQLYYLSGGTPHMLANTAAVNATATRRIAIAVNGNAMQGWYNGLLGLTANDGGVVPRTANPGITVFNDVSGTFCDDFSAQTFTSAPAAPTITALMPSSAAIGATVTVTGTGFYADFTEISIGGVHVPVTVTSLTTGTFVVPTTVGGPGTATLTTPFGTDSDPFTVLTTTPWMGNTTEGVGTSSVTVAKPSGYTGAANQQLFLLAFTASVAPPDLPVPPAGFTMVGTPSASTALAGATVYTVWFRSTTDVSAASSYTVTASGNTVVGRVICGVINSTGGPGNPTYDAGVGGTSNTLPPLTTTLDNSLVLAFGTADEGNSISVPDGYAAATVEGTNYSYFDMWQSLKATAGAVARPFISISGTSSGIFVSTLAYGPVVGAPVALAGSSAGVATATAALGRAVPLAGSSAGVSTDTAALARAVPVAGSSVGVGTTTSALARAVPVAGAAAGTSTTTGALAIGLTLAGSSAGTSTDTSALARAVPLAGSSAGTSTVTGSFVGTTALAGSSAGGSTAVATTLVATRALAGSSAGVGAAGGDLSRTSASGIFGNSAGTGNATGSLSVLHSLAGSSAGSSAGSASLERGVPLVGGSVGVSTTTGALARVVPLAGASAGVGAVPVAPLRLIVALEGSADGLSTVLVGLAVAHTLVGLSNGATTATGDMFVGKGQFLVGSSAGKGTARATVQVIFVAPIYGIWNGQVFDAMQYGDKQVAAFQMDPT